MSFDLRGTLARFYGWWHRSPASPGLSPEEQGLVARIKSRNLSFLPVERFTTIVETCRSIENAGISGAFIEAGCALGGSTILIASLKNAQRPFAVYDVFGMIPPPTTNDGQDVHDRYRVIAAGAAQ